MSDAADPAPDPVTDPAARWSELHHGIDPGGVPFLRAWLSLTWLLARPLVGLRVRPVVITLVGALLALDALFLAARLPAVALVLVVASVLCDGLDGAVAVLADRASAAGASADMLADRVSDVAFAAVLWRVGAPWWLALSAGGLSLVHEGVRRLAGGAALAAITVAERPTRAVCTVLACGCAAVTTAQWPMTVCAAVWVALAVVGLVQLMMRRH